MLAYVTLLGKGGVFSKWAGTWGRWWWLTRHFPSQFSNDFVGDGPHVQSSRLSFMPWMVAIMQFYSLSTTDNSLTDEIRSLKCETIPWSVRVVQAPFHSTQTMVQSHRCHLLIKDNSQNRIESVTIPVIHKSWNCCNLCWAEASPISEPGGFVWRRTRRLKMFAWGSAP